MCWADQSAYRGSDDAARLSMVSHHVAGPLGSTWCSGRTSPMNDERHTPVPGITRRTAPAGIWAGGIDLLLAAGRFNLAGAQDATLTGPVGARCS